jgi:DNA-binding XRE family transcriptional regulator
LAATGGGQVGVDLQHANLEASMPWQTAMTDVEAALDEAVAGRRVKIRWGGGTVAVVPVADLALLQKLEDLLDVEEARAALAEFKASGERLIPLAEVIEELLQDPEVRAEWERNAVARAVSLWLVRYRAEQGLSQRALAARVGMAQSAIGRMEAGDTEPKMTTLLRLSRALGVLLELQVDRTGDAAEAETIRIDGTPAEAAHAA